MKITIIGGGLCGLYIAYLLKKVNIDYEIYEKSSRPGGNLKNICVGNKFTVTENNNRFILPYHLNMIDLLNTLKIKYVTVSGKKLLSLTNLDEKSFNNILNKILITYKKDLPTNISAIDYIKSILSDDEYDIFKENLFMEQSLKNEISDFMKYLFFDLKLSNKVICDDNKDNCIQNNYIKIKEIEGTNAIINKLANYVQEKLNLNHKVQEITYMPITNSYLLLINDKLVQVDRLIIATNASIKYITLNIPNKIKNNLNYIKPIKIIKLYTLHDKPIQLKKDRVIQTQSIITNIMLHNSNILESTFIANSSNKNSLLINKNTKEVIQILNKLFKNITGMQFPKIIDYKLCSFNYGAHYNTKIIKTNFWNSHNLIFAGEFVHPYHGWMEGSVMSALDTYKIITKDLFIDRLKH
jgi:hypothetical protein